MLLDQVVGQGTFQRDYYHFIKVLIHNDRIIYHKLKCLLTVVMLKVVSIVSEVYAKTNLKLS
jgi:hypothetical protein